MAANTDLKLTIQPGLVTWRLAATPDEVQWSIPTNYVLDPGSPPPMQALLTIGNESYNLTPGTTKSYGGSGDFVSLTMEELPNDQSSLTFWLNPYNQGAVPYPLQASILNDGFYTFQIAQSPEPVQWYLGVSTLVPARVLLADGNKLLEELPQGDSQLTVVASAPTLSIGSLTGPGTIVYSIQRAP